MGINVYQMVTDRIIEQLSKGKIPWQKPWFGVANGAFNRVTKRPYSLLNQMMLMHEGDYATFKQWTDLGGRIKKGAKSEIVVFWKMFHVDDKDDSAGEGKDSDEKGKLIPMLRYYNVFHVSQVEGVEPLSKDVKLNDISPIEQAEDIINAYVARENIKFVSAKGNRAFYSPVLDQICLPLMEQFISAEEFYSTAFHEAVHSTGYSSRLNRLTNGRFGSQNYAKEELVAELGAAFLLNMIGIEKPATEKNNAAYIQSWLGQLQNDNKLIVSAAGKAEKAVDYILKGKEAAENVA